MAAAVARHILLTGPPGVGKTTLVQKVFEHLEKHGIDCRGFYTEEKREHGQRVGFDVVTLTGERGPLATVNTSDLPVGRQYTVGKYVVQLQSFENTALPTLRKKEGEHNIFVVDEIGKMELFSQSFVRQIKAILDSKNTTVVTTLPLAKGKPIAVVEQIRQRSDAILFRVTKSNRDVLLDDIVKAVLDSIKFHGG